MTDIFHNYGDDLVIAAPGDYLTTDDPIVQANQTITRFILTNPGDDPFNTAFGLGAASIIGEVDAVDQIKTLVQQGMATLDVVDQTQPVTVGAFYNTQNYSLNVSVNYTVAGTSNTVTVVVAVES